MIAIVYPHFYADCEVARHLDYFLMHLPKSYPKVYLITDDASRVERRYENVELVHIPYSTNRFSLFFWSLKARKIVCQLYAQKKIRFINLHLPPLIPSLVLPSYIPIVLTVHSTYKCILGQGGKPTMLWQSLALNMKIAMEKRIFKQAVKIVTLTERERLMVKSYGINTHTEVVSDGVGANIFSAELNVEHMPLI